MNHEYRLGLRRLFRLGRKYERLTNSNYHNEARRVQESAEIMYEIIEQAFMDGG